MKFRLLTILLLAIVFSFCSRKEVKKVSMRLELEGMHCNGCATTIENTLKDLKGTEYAHASFDSAYALLSIDTNQTGTAEIVKAVEKKGYKVKSIEINE